MVMVKYRTVRTTSAAAFVALVAAACGAADRGEPSVTAVAEVASPAAPGSGEPNLAVGPDDRVYLSWLEPASPTAAASTRSGRYALRFAVLDAGAAADGPAGWSEPRTVAVGDDFFVNWADFPSIAALPDGTLAAHWLVRSGPGTYAYDVHLARSTDGGRSWTDPRVPHRDGTKTEHGFVSLFPWSGGGIAAVWLDGRKYPEDGGHGETADGADPEMTLRHAVLGPDGELSPAALLDGRVCDCCQTAAARTSRGPVIAYRDRSPDEIRDISVVRHVDGRWTEPRPVHRDGWHIPACPVNGPSIAADGETVTVGWYSAADDTPRVRVAFSHDAGATFAPPLRVDDGAPVGRVDVELLPDGTALVSWLEDAEGGDALLRVRRIAPDGRADGAATVARSSGARASGFPRMVRVGERLVFAWTVPGEPAQVRVATATWNRS